MAEPINIYGGKLETVSRYALLASIRMANLSGTLTFARGVSRKELLFSDGYVVGSSSNQLDDAIGTLLHAWGTITTDAYRQLQLKNTENSRLQFGEHLLSMAAIDRTTLTNVLREQVLWRVGELFTWPDGTYMFTPGEVTPRIEALPYVEVFGAAIRYSLGSDYLRFAQTMLLDTKPQPVRDSMFELMIFDEPDLAGLYDRITGRIPFRGLLGPTDAQRFWQNVFILRELECIRFEMPPDLGGLREVATQSNNRQDGIVDRALFLRAAQSAYEKGRRALQSRKFEEAEEHFYVAVTLAPDAGEYAAFLAWSRVQRNPQDRAVLDRSLAVLRKATQSTPASHNAAFFHAGVLWLLGQKPAAMAEFERVASLMPKHPVATFLIQKMSNETTGLG